MRRIESYRVAFTPELVPSIVAFTIRAIIYENVK